MSEGIDYNKIAVELVNQNIDKFYNSGKGILKGAADTIRLHLSKSYKDYLSCITERYSKAKSFFIRHEPTFLYDFYVPLGVSCGEKIIENASISEILSITPFAVLTGGAGSGKSMMMRHLLLDTILMKERVPIFLELRELNQTPQPLNEFIQNTLNSNHFTLDSAYIEKALKAGHFLLFFDGFDEISHSLRKTVSNQIQQLAKNNDKNAIIVSSRPDHEFSGWQAFSVLQMSPLILKQACELVEKLPFDTEIKAKFLIELRDSLFENHESFLSNPLLLSIMLLTYEMNADIPSKLSVFYNQAYEALFQRHDALKGGYQRDRLSILDIQDFAKVFAAFSIQTYDKRIFQFSRSKALEYLEKAKHLLSSDFNSNEYLTDALQAVCLLIEDGLLINFSHRSFQEYFAACFIGDSKPDVQQKLIDRYSKHVTLDSVMDLLYEMKPELAERAYIIPGLEKLEHVIGFKRKLGIAHYTRYIKTEFASLRIKNEMLVSLIHSNNSPGFYKLIKFTLNHCGSLVGWTGFDKGSIKITKCEKYGSKSNEVNISTSKLTYRDEFIKEMASGKHLFSQHALEWALKVKKALNEKHTNLDRSLDEILGA